MARVTVEDCLEKVPNRFDLVLMAAKRARLIANGQEPMVEEENDKPTVLALREIAEEKINDEVLAELELEAKRARELEAWNAAAETQDAFEYGRQKLLRKGLNYIAVNDVTAEGAGFGVDTNKIVLLSSAGIVEEMPLQSKTAVAERLVHHVAKTLNGR